MATLDATATPGWRTRAQIWPPELLLVLVLVAAAISVAPLNTDSGWLLVAARRLLDGDRLYVDIIEVNPPLIVWLLVPSAWVGRHLAVDDTIVVAVPVIGLEILCGLMALAALRRAPATPRTATTLAVGAFLIAFGLLSMGQVGQRDAMAGLLLLPYAALATRAASGLSAPWLLSIVAGVAGGLAVAIKPFFVAPWIAIEIAVAVSRREFASPVRVETVIVLLMQLAYASLVWLITPEWLTRIVPLARMTYGAYGASLGEVARTRTSQSLLMCGFAGALSSLGVSTKRVHRLPEVLGAATLGFWAGYVIQSKEWFYQSIPVLLFGAASLAASVEHLVASLRELRAARPLARAGIAMVALIVLVSAKWIRPAALTRMRGGITFMRTPYSPMEQSLADELSRRAVGEPVYMLSTSLFPAFPAVNLAGAAWPYHYGHLWPLPAFYPEKGPPGYRKPEAQSPVERRFFETVVSDLLERPPRLIVVERGLFKQALGSRPFDFIEYFSGSPDFVELMRGYRSVSYVGSWELYERALY